jgi:hypothetical protein
MDETVTMPGPDGAPPTAIAFVKTAPNNASSICQLSL